MKLKVVAVEMYDVVDLDQVAPNGEPQHPEGRIMFNTRDLDDAHQFIRDQEDVDASETEE